MNARRFLWPAWIWHVIGAAISILLIGLIGYSKAFGAMPIAVWAAAICGATGLLFLPFLSASIRGGVNFELVAPSVRQVLGWALITRLLTLFSTPYFEDDFYRYLWDGYQTVIGGNPYLFAPAKFFASEALVLGGAPAPEAVAHALSALNNPDIPTIYGPALQWLFALSAHIAPGALWPIRVLWLAADLLLVSALITHCGARRAMLYALCPLVLHEVGVAAHPDGLIGAALFFACVALKKQQAWRSGVWLGCAVAMKIHALLALPFLLLAVMLMSGNGAPLLQNVGSIARQCVRLALACVLTYAVFWLPFVVPPMGSEEAFLQAFRSFATFARDWQFNALGFALILQVTEGHAARVIAGAVMGFAWLAILVMQLRQGVSGDVVDGLKVALVGAFGALLLLAPVINAWYLLWLLPLAVGTRYVTPWVACLVLPLSYLTYFNLGIVAGVGAAVTTNYSLPTAIPVLEGMAVGLALCWDTWSRRGAEKA